MKVAPIIAAIRKHNDELLLVDRGNGSRIGRCEAIQHILVHTGQHYDHRMSDSFFADLGLPTPDVYLGVGSGSHAMQTAEVMRKFEDVLLQETPDVLVVVGDVNSTLACALVAAKASVDAGFTRPVVAHVEAGLRSFDRSMPEEINRILTDQLSDLLFVTEESALDNLAREGVPAERVFFVGNTMIDSLLACSAQADASAILDVLGFRSANGLIMPYALLTLHRPANVDNRSAFINILNGLQDLAEQYPILFPAHPRTQKRIAEFGLDGYFSATVDRPHRVHMLEPLGYLDCLCLMKHAHLVITDSGGIQEETTCLRVPCVTVRDNTERPVTVEKGTNVLAGVQAEGIRLAINQQLGKKFALGTPEKWDGAASARIVSVLLTALPSFRNTQGPQRLEHLQSGQPGAFGRN
jgi:UDP-N-acetylglucosamine 2-epimerase (non-hydrolysing)